MLSILRNTRIASIYSTRITSIILNYNRTINTYHYDLIFTSDKYKLLKLQPYNLTFNRCKYNKGKQSSKTDEDEDSDETNDENFDFSESDKSTKIVTATVNSLRTDLVLKAGLGIARNKVESAFYQSKVRINSRKVHKKSQQIKIGDEIDIVRCVSPTNPNFLIVSRVEILSLTERGENISVKLKRNKSLLIENYEEPWKPVAEN